MTALTCVPSLTASAANAPEDCKYCAQSAHYHTSLEESYPLLSTEELVKGPRKNKRKGVLRYSIVTSGRKLSDQGGGSSL